jgi:N-formylglutamate amidohydrolase
MDNDEMSLVEYIEYLKAKLDEIEWVARYEEIHEDYKKNIVALLDEIDKNIYGIYVLIEGYFGWEDFI